MVDIRNITAKRLMQARRRNNNSGETNARYLSRHVRKLIVLKFEYNT